MEMDNEVVGLIRDRLESIDKKLETLTEVISRHEASDRQYWTKIDHHEGQLSTLKWIFGGTLTSVLGAIGTWLMTKFGVK